MGQPILSPHGQDKASTLCRWLSGWRETRLVRYFPTLTSESINLTLSWIHIQPLLIRGWRKTGPAHSFPILTSESINLVQKLSYLGGEKLGWSNIFPPWQVKASILPCHEYVNNLCFLGCGGITGPAHSFPTPTSESINLNLSWICKQPLRFRGWGKTGPAHSFPTLTSVSINLLQNLGYLGGEKLGRPILSQHRLVKVSTLTCHEYANNLSFLRGGGKTGPAHSFPTLTR